MNNNTTLKSQSIAAVAAASPALAQLLRTAVRRFEQATDEAIEATKTIERNAQQCREMLEANQFGGQFLTGAADTFAKAWEARKAIQDEIAGLLYVASEDYDVEVSVADALGVEA